MNNVEIDENLTTKWNMMDRFMLKVDGLILEVKTAVQELKDSGAVDPEQIVSEAIKPLEEENRQLKERDYPKIAVRQGDKLVCPGCYREIEKSDVGFFCKKCGQRISANIGQTP